MSYPYWANMIATDKDIANAAAEKIDPDGGSATFGNVRLRKIGESAVSAWATSTPLTAGGEALFSEFSSAGPWPSLSALGVSDVPSLKAALLVEHGPRAEFEGRLQAFIEAHGYERVPGAPGFA